MKLRVKLIAGDEGGGETRIGTFATFEHPPQLYGGPACGNNDQARRGVAADDEQTDRSTERLLIGNAQKPRPAWSDHRDS